MSSNIQETIIAFSKTAQSAIHTANTDVIRVNTISNELSDVEPVVEDDADEIGKGHEFAEESFLTSWKVSKSIEVYNSAEMLAIAAAFGLGQGTGDSFTPIDPITNENEIELPWMTFYEAIRPTGNAVLDRALIGCVVDKFSFMMKSGPGRANSTLKMDLVGSGKITDPSGLTYPSKTAVHLLPSASLTCTINGTDYVTAKNFVELSFEWNNNVRQDSGYFPGSGTQTDGDASTGAIMGRMEYGKREFKLSYKARFVNGSTELTTLNNQTAGTAVIGMSGGTGFACGLTVHQSRFKMAKVDNTDGIVTVSVDISGQVPAGESASGLLTIDAAQALGTIGR